MSLLKELDRFQRKPVFYKYFTPDGARRFGVETNTVGIVSISIRERLQRVKGHGYRRFRALGFVVFFFSCDLLFALAGLVSAWFASLTGGATSSKDAVISASLGRVPSRNTKT